jgi:hypothetical protein
MVRNLAHVILNEVKNLDLLVGSKKNEILRLCLRMTLRPSLFEGQGRVKMIRR